MWKVYILECQNGTFYTGITKDLKRRFNEHAAGKGGHYTACNKPIRVVRCESFDNRLEAERREQQIKRWSRSKKLALIQNDGLRLKKLSISRD